MSADLGRARPHHAHRPLAPLQGVRADAQQRRGAAGRSTSSSSRTEVHRERRLGRQPRDYDNRASYTVYDSDTKRFEFKRIEYDIETAADKVLRAKLERNFAHRLFIGV